MKSFYCEIYDAKYSSDGTWIENKCSDPECQFCAKRPEKHKKNCKCDKKDYEQTKH